MLKSFVIVSVYNKGSDIISVLESVTSENLEIVDLKVLVLKDGSSALAGDLFEIRRDSKKQRQGRISKRGIGTSYRRLRFNPARTKSSPVFEPSSFVGFLGVVRTIWDLPILP